MINVTKSDLPSLEKYTEYLEKIWSTRWLTNNGEFVQLLEKRLEEYLKVKNLILVINGTLALQLALKALDIKGEIITTPFLLFLLPQMLYYGKGLLLYSQILMLKHLILILKI
jgi:dTDP-4-amino-4,6-dideoxygalactose transaminase